jgi:hypothetical protein
MLWIILAPIVTVPSTWALTTVVIGTNACNPIVEPFTLFGGPSGYSCEVGPLLTALAPGLLNLAPILWLRSRNLKTRVAAITATILGAVRLAFPAVAMVVIASDHSVNASSLGALPCNGGCTYVLSSWLLPAFPNSGTFVIGDQWVALVANFDLLAISVLMWVLTFVVLIAMSRAMRRRPVA